MLVSLQSVWSDEGGQVVVSIAPIHSLVKEVMGESGDPVLLLSGYSSPHSFQLKPSQLRKMQSAQIIFYVSRGFETFLNRSFNSLSPDVIKFGLMSRSSVNVLPYRKGGVWENEEEHGHHHEQSDAHAEHIFEDDPHIWLDPDNAIIMVRQISLELGNVFPKNQSVYRENAQLLIDRITAMDQNNAKKLIEVADIPFVVFHDSYQYFEKHYGLSSVGSLLLEPNSSPSIARLREIRAKIRDTNAKCIFREPQFDDKLIRTASEGTNIRSGLLDPLGSGLVQGAGLYIKMMENLTDQMINCLK